MPADWDTKAVPDARSLPPGLVMLPNGQRMTAKDFFRLHGNQLAAYPDAQIAIEVPAYQPSQEMHDALKGTVGVVSTLLAAVLIRNGTAAKVVGGFISGYIGTDVAEWCDRAISHGASVRIVTPRQIMRGY